MSKSPIKAATPSGVRETTQSTPPESAAVSRATRLPALDSFSQYLSALSSLAPLPIEMEKELAERVRAGDTEARDTLVRHNLRFVISIARKYLSHGIPLEDLVQDGNSGLIQALNTFNPDKGVPLVNYAAFSISQAIRHGIAHQKRQVRLPVNRATELYRIQKASNHLAEKLGRTPSREEIAEETGITPQVVGVLLDASQPEVSLDSPLPNEPEGSLSLADRIGSEEDFTLEMDKQSRDVFLMQALSSLPERDARILCLIHGIDCSREHTLEEIGEIYGITRERIRQIRDRALKRLLATPESRTLLLLWNEGR